MRLTRFIKKQNFLIKNKMKFHLNLSWLQREQIKKFLIRKSKKTLATLFLSFIFFHALSCQTLMASPTTYTADYSSQSSTFLSRHRLSFLTNGSYKNHRFSLQKYNHLDPQRLVPDDPFVEALQFYDSYSEALPNKKYLTIIDFSPHSSKKRMFIINMRTGFVSLHHVSHGAGSDPNRDGFATLFSNTRSSHMSSLGFYLTGTPYRSSKGYSLLVYGLSPSNSLATEREIIFHPASYVRPGLSRIGNSHGCFALNEKDAKPIIDRISYGGIVYAWVKRKNSPPPASTHSTQLAQAY